ncbi:hypothetical protein [Frigoribacterium sp. UYMn621]|uniref:hypothetical protein n=1 Tax=Frigoribacterium sp. UYMn621 TaxID=3156343 RepID=UPI003392EAC7
MTDSNRMRHLEIVERGTECGEPDLDWIATGINATIDLDPQSRFPTLLNEAPQD